MVKADFSIVEVKITVIKCTSWCQNLIKCIFQFDYNRVPLTGDCFRDCITIHLDVVQHIILLEFLAIQLLIVWHGARGIGKTMSSLCDLSIMNIFEKACGGITSGVGMLVNLHVWNAFVTEQCYFAWLLSCCLLGSSFVASFRNGFMLLILACFAALLHWDRAHAIQWYCTSTGSLFIKQTILRQYLLKSRNCEIRYNSNRHSRGNWAGPLAE